ncbi:MAG: Uma2 family endonuclease [Gemmataceae bacterium]
MGKAAVRPKFDTLEELLHDLGDIAPRRIRLDSLPGRATVRDVVRLNERGTQLYELVDGVLVEKVMGRKESLLASRIITAMSVFAELHDLGDVTGEAGTYRIVPDLVRAPDVAFTSWARQGGKDVPDDAAPPVAPDLSVQVLSPSNTRGEIARKLREYFFAGVRLVWIVDPKTRTVRSHTAPDEFVELAASDTLDGGDVLPGFRLPLAKLFARLPTPAKKPRKKNGRGRV